MPTPPFASLLLTLWRHIACGVRGDQLVPTLAPLLAPYLVADKLLILQYDSGAAQWQVLSSRGVTITEPQWAAVPIAPATWSAHPPAAPPTGLLPPTWTGAAVAIALAWRDELLGAFVLGMIPMELTAQQMTLLELLREPLAIAIRHVQQQREWHSWREAAESDRRALLARLGRQDITEPLIGAGTGLQDVMAHVELVARSTAPVLLLGETGSGKEVIARAIHQRSLQRRGPFLRVNCGAIPTELADSELFGHERGSFTGAQTQRKGWFERADGGTLLLDEIGELTPAIQVRLLRILQDGTFERVGGQQPLRVTVRLIAATHRDLPAMVQRGEFREDLWYRIGVFPIHLPPLRERRADIPAMATHFALRAAERLGITPQVPTPADVERLLRYTWPGNVRELAAVIERAAILGDGKRLDIAQSLGTGAMTPAVATPELAPMNAAQAIDQAASCAPLAMVTRQHVERALRQCHGRIEGPFGAAQLLAVNPSTLRSKLRHWGLTARAFRERGA